MGDGCGCSCFPCSVGNHCSACWGHFWKAFLR